MANKPNYTVPALNAGWTVDGVNRYASIQHAVPLMAGLTTDLAGSAVTVSSMLSEAVANETNGLRHQLGASSQLSVSNTGKQYANAGTMAIWFDRTAEPLSNSAYMLSAYTTNAAINRVSQGQSYRAKLRAQSDGPAVSDSTPFTATGKHLAILTWDINSFEFYFDSSANRLSSVLAPGTEGGVITTGTFIGTSGSLGSIDEGAIWRAFLQLNVRLTPAQIADFIANEWAWVQETGGGNAAPTYNSSHNKTYTFEVGQAISIPAGSWFQDPGDTLAFNVQAGTLPAASCSINAGTGLISGTANAGNVGAHSGITIRATDTAAQTATSDAISITITAAASGATIGAPFAVVGQRGVNHY